MKFKEYKTIILAAILILGISSCGKEFLEISPKGMLIAETTEEYDLLLNDASIVNLAIQNAMGDHIAAMDPYFNGRTSLIDQNFFRWADDIYLPTQSTTMFGSVSSGIYRYNKVVNEVLKSTGGTQAQKAAVHAEALAGRAWSYFTLVNLYAKPYNKTTAATDLGLPMMLEADLTKITTQRSSVQAVYDYIVADLKSAIPNLPETLSHRVRMSRPAGEALLGKVYMFMGEWSLAQEHLKNAVAGFEHAAIPLKVYDYEKEFDEDGFFYPMDEEWGPSYNAITINEEVAFLKATSNTFNINSNELLYTKATIDLYTPNDLRLNFFSKVPYGEPTKVFPLGMRRGFGKYAVNHGINVTDIILLLAECKSRLNDLPGALKELDKLRSKRMPAVEAVVPAAIASDRLALTKFILEERIREFALEGTRWADMRRLSVDPDFKTTVGSSHTLYDMSGATVQTFQLRPERMTMRFPLYITEWNPTLTQNP